MKSKGFIYLLEAVLVAFIIIVSIPYFLIPSEIEPDWNRARLMTLGKDILKILDEEGYLEKIMTKSPSSINSKFNQILGNKRNIIGFNLRTRGAYKNIIRVGCNCTKSEEQSLEKFLTPMYFNGRKIRFKVIPFSYEDLPYLNFDVILFWNIEDVKILNNGNNFEIFKDFLDEDKGVVEFVNLTESNILNTQNIQNEIFGITSNPGNTGGNLSFTNRENTSKPNYEVGKVFYGTDVETSLSGISEKEGYLTLWTTDYKVRTNDSDLDGVYDEVDISNDTDPFYEYKNFHEGDQFLIKNFTFSIEKIDPNGTQVNFNIISEYIFQDFVNSETAYPLNNEIDRIVLKTKGNQPGLIVNSTLQKKAAWVSKGKGDDISSLLKSTILWSSKNEWWNVLKTVSGRKVQVRYMTSQGEEIHEPYEVILTLWYAY